MRTMQQSSRHLQQQLLARISLLRQRLLLQKLMLLQRRGAAAALQLRSQALWSWWQPPLWPSPSRQAGVGAQEVAEALAGTALPCTVQYSLGWVLPC